MDGGWWMVPVPVPVSKLCLSACLGVCSWSLAIFSLAPSEDSFSTLFVLISHHGRLHINSNIA